jgi:predicted O-methyltransferase YrrM
MNSNTTPQIHVGFTGEPVSPRLEIQFTEGEFELILRDSVAPSNKFYQLVQILQRSGGTAPQLMIEGEPAPYLRQVLNIIPNRAAFALKYYLAPKLQTLLHWLVTSKELDNYTYDNDASCLQYWASSLSLVLQCSPQQVLSYLQEPIADEELQQTIVATYDRQPVKPMRDRLPKFGRRLAWYACARALKPKLLIETGVHQGLGSILLCAALKRNTEEGHPGVYMGTDIDPGAGSLLIAPYNQYGKVHYGDSIETLKMVNQPIDLFINDSDHSSDYEAREYETIAAKLSGKAVVLGDNAHVTDKLMQFAWNTQRHFLFLNEKPENHWYPCAGVGVVWGNSAKTPMTSGAHVQVEQLSSGNITDSDKFIF